MANSLAEMLVNPPDLEEHKTYADFKTSVNAWKDITHVKPGQQGAVLAYLLSDNSKFGPDLRKRVYKECPSAQLKGAEDGVQKVLAVLDKYLESTGMAQAAERWDKFIDIARKSGQTIKQYIGHYEEICQDYSETIGTLSPFAKALHLLRTAKLSDIQYEMILAMCEGDQNTDLIYDKIKKAVVCQLSDKLNTIKGATREIPAEQAFIAESDDDEEVTAAKDVLAASYYKKQAWKKKQFQQQQNKPQSNYKQGYSNNYNKGNYKPRDKQSSNKDNDDEDSDRCYFCRSKTHHFKDCQQLKKLKNQYHNRKRNTPAFVNLAENQDLANNCPDNESDDDPGPGNVLLSDNLASPKQPEISRFREEAKNCAALDTCCTQTVAGEMWLKDFLNSIPDNIQHLVQGPLPATKQFRFGNNQLLTAISKWKLPVYLGGKLTEIEVYIIPSDIPMLMSKEDLANNDAILYMRKDKAQLNGEMVRLRTTTAGHFIINLLQDEENDCLFLVEQVLAIDILTADPKTQFQMLTKIHKQFGHRPKQAFVDVLKNAEAWDPSFSSMLNKIIDACEGCILRKRTPDRPAVAMSMARNVNDVVAMDLKKLKNGKHILYIIDTFSRFTMAKIIPRKKPEEVIDAIMEKWISILGTPTKLITDNGGEFSNEEMQLATAKLNIIHNTTAAESPWQNGLCEKNHATVDNILEALEQDYPKIPLATLLLWACVAKNSLLMVQGFSPYQIVFGKNPKLPNIITDPLPAWDNEGISDALANHLNAMKATKEAFIKSEDSAKLKIALEKKVRTNNYTYNHGDRVYFKRPGYGNWFNGRVVFQDGKVIFVRSGTYFYRCSANMIIKAGTELSKALEEESSHETPTMVQDEDDFETADEGEDITSEANETITNEQSDTLGTSEPSSPSIENQNTNNANTINPDTQQQTLNETIQEDTSSNQETIPTTTEINESCETPDHDEPENHDVNNSENNEEPTTSKNTSTTPTQIKPLKLKRNDLIECFLDGKWLPGTVMQKGTKSSHPEQHWYNIVFEDGTKDCIDVSRINTRRFKEDNSWMHEEVMVTILSPEKNTSPDCIEAKLAELEKLKEFKTYSEVPDNGQESISTTWVLTEKEGAIRARLTARGYEEETNVRSDSPTVQSTSMRFLLMLTAIKKWTICSTDIKSAFLQGQTLDREVYIKPPRESNSPNKLWKLNKCLYGLNDASRKWFEEMERRFDELGFHKSCQDPALYIYKKKGKILGIVALHVDDFMHAGDDNFRKNIMPKLLKGLVVGSTEETEFTYTGFTITQDSKGITIDQDAYLDSITIPQLDAERQKDTKSPLTTEETTYLRMIMGKANWVIRATRPDLSFDMVHLSCKFNRGTVSDVLEASAVITKTQENRSFVRIPDLEQEDDLEIWTFSDASKDTVDDKMGSVGAYIIFIANKATGKAAPIAWRAAKVKRACISAMEAEALTMQEALNASIGVQQLTKECFGYSIPIMGVIDNYSTYENVKTNKQVKNARLKKEIYTVKQMQKHRHVGKIMWLQGNQMIADCMTKKGKPGHELLEALQTGFVGKSMEAANASEYIMTYDPKVDKELGQYMLEW